MRGTASAAGLHWEGSLLRWGGGCQTLAADPSHAWTCACRLHFPQLALRRRLGQLSCMSRPALKLRSWPLTVLYYLLPFGALRPLSRVGWRPVSRVSVCRLSARPTAGQPECRVRGGAVGAEPSRRVVAKG